MSEEAARLERIIYKILDILERHIPDLNREGIDAVVSGFDVGREDDE